MKVQHKNYDLDASLNLMGEYFNERDADNDKLLLSELDDNYDYSDVMSLSNMYSDLDDSEFSIVSSDGEIDEVPSTPLTGNDSGISSEIMALIRDEYEAIEGYNNAIMTMKSLSNDEYADIIKIMQDIANEENIHVGQLQSALKLVSPNAISINNGAKEATQQILSNNVDVAHPGIKVNSMAPVTSNVNIDADDCDDTICSLSDVDDTF